MERGQLYKTLHQSYKIKHLAKFHKGRIEIAMSTTIKPQIRLNIYFDRLVYIRPISKTEPIILVFNRGWLWSKVRCFVKFHQDQLMFSSFTLIIRRHGQTDRRA